MKHKKHLRKQGSGANGGTSNGNQSDDNYDDKSNEGSVNETGDEDSEDIANRERGENSWLILSKRSF